MAPGRHKDPAWLTALEPYIGEAVEPGLRKLTILSVISSMASADAQLNGVRQTQQFLRNVIESLENGIWA